LPNAIRPEGVMRHDWIIDVLADLQSYARQNDMPELAAKVDDVLTVARDAIETAKLAATQPLTLPRRAH